MCEMTTKIRVEHSSDGTTVHDTSRGDREAIAALKTCGFRWSRNLSAWFLPRSWREATRRGRVRDLQARLGERVTVEVSQEPGRSAAEREAEQRRWAQARAERLEARAERASRAAEAAEGSARQVLDRIPLGQPVLVGHHSQRRHERDLARVDRQMRRSLEQSQRAEAAAAGAQRARRAASGQESTVRVGNRIERNEAELHSVERKLHGTGKAIHGEDVAATGGYAARLQQRRLELLDELQHDQAKVEAAGGVTYSAQTVQVGDLVRIRGLWYPVIRANAKSVTVPSPMLPAESKRTERAPWREVQDHLAGECASSDQVRHLASTCSSAFPGLRERLEHIAQRLED